MFNFFKRRKSGIYAPELMLRKKDIIEEVFGIRGEVQVLVLDRETDILKRKIGEGGNAIYDEFLLWGADMVMSSPSAANQFGILPYISSTVMRTSIANGTSYGGGVLHSSLPFDGLSDLNGLKDTMPNVEVLMATTADTDPGDRTTKYRQFLGVFDEGVAYDVNGYLILGTGFVGALSYGVDYGTLIANYAQNITITSAEKVHVHWKISFA